MSVDLKGFKVRGRSSGFAGQLPACGKRAIQVLDKLPFKQLMRTRELAELVGVQHHTIQHIATLAQLSEYRFTVSKSESLLWGSKKTIKELKRINTENK